MTNNPRSKPPEVLSFGEILIDKISTTPGLELPDVTTWDDLPGGAPANTAVALSRLNIPTAFLGGIGDDKLGSELKLLLQHEGVDVSGAIVIPGAETRKAYVVTTASRDRKLADFTRTNCADACFGADQVLQTRELFDRADIFHFGSITLIDPRSAQATMTALSLAKAAGMINYYDPNLRPALWQSLDTCRSAVLSTLDQAEIVKINREELEILCQAEGDPLVLAKQFRHTHGIPVLLVTLDSKGALFVCADGHGEVPGFDIEGNFVEATGAGDAFNAGFEASLMAYLRAKANSGFSRRTLLTKLSPLQLSEMVRYANMVGALACQKVGAIPSMPTLAQLAAFMDAHA